MASPRPPLDASFRPRAPGQRLEVPAAWAERIREEVRPLIDLGSSGPAGEPHRLDPESVRIVLETYGISMPQGRVVSSADAAVAAAEAIGWPVALKPVSRTITHKSDVGGVALGLRDAGELDAAYRAMLDRLATLGRAGEVTGVLVEEMVDRTAGVETFIGIAEAEELGALIGFGLGGTQVELPRDVVFLANPITDTDAEEMLARIRGAALLTGFRGSPGVDRPALVDALLRLSRLAEDFPEIVALDVDPLLALPPGRGVMALDARIRVRG